MIEDSFPTSSISGASNDLVENWLKNSTEPDATLKQRLAHILTLSEDAIVSINEGQLITLFNPAAERMFGYEAHEVLGRPVDILLPSRFVDIHRRHTRSFIASPDVIRPMNQRGDIFGRRKDGTEFPAEASISKSNLNGEVMLIVRMRDMTERKRSEAAMLDILSHTQELYEMSRRIAAVRTLDEVLQVLMSNSHFAACSRSAILVFDRPWAEQGSPPDQLEVVASWSREARIPPLPHERFVLDLSWIAHSAIRNRPVFVGDLYTEPGLPEYARRALTQLDVRSFALFALKASGEWFGILALQYITPGVVSAEDVRHVEGLVDQTSVAIRNIRLFEAEARARREAEAANALRLKFLAMISHELRTPLTSIKGFASTLLAEDISWDAAQQHDFIATINSEADKLTEMIDQLLDLSRIDSGVLRVHVAAHTLGAIISHAMPQLIAIAPQHRLAINVARTLPPVSADIQRIAQVLTNLVDNAAKYSPSGSEIVISAIESDAFVQVEVSDQGPGISSAELPHIFEAFQRGENGPVRRTRGAGLGLAICKGIIEAHGGRIWIADRPEPGTSVVFTLPLLPLTGDRNASDSQGR